MNMLKMLIAAVLGSITSFLAGWVIYGMLLMDMMNKSLTPEGAAVYKKEPNLGLIFLSGLLTSLLMAYIYERWAKIRTFGSGAILGAVMGLLIAASIDVSFAAMTTIYAGWSMMFVDIAANGVMMALIGGVIGWYLGFKRND